MGPKLAAVLVHLSKVLGSLYKMQVVKLPYLVDVHASYVFGTPMTEGTHEAWGYGVVTSEAWKAIRYPEQQQYLVVREHRHPYTEHSKFSFEALGVPDLTSDETEIVESVAEQFGGVAPRDLERLTKAMNPEIPKDEWASNRLAAVNDDAYVRLSNEWLTLWEELPNLDPRKGGGEPIGDIEAHLDQFLDA